MILDSKEEYREGPLCSKEIFLPDRFGGLVFVLTNNDKYGIILSKNELEEVNGFGLVQTFAHDKLGRQTESRIDGIYSKKATYLKYCDHTTDMIADLTYRISNGNTDREKYSYDKEGNISAIHENGRLKVKYTYDALNRLIREDNKELDLTTTFEYDNGGNLLRQNEYAYSLVDTDELTDGNEIVYTYAESRSDKLTDFNGEAITYDANGCPITYRDNNCEYTRGTLLSKYGSNTFEYDADGIRTKKNGITFTYVDGKLIRQTGGSGTIDFIYGAGGAIGFKFAGNTYIYRRNLMGDVTHIYTTDGTLVARYVYDAWGNHRIITNVDNIGTINPIRYRGYYYDTETDLYYLEARYYDPETGRFISQDSIDFLVPDHLTGLNLYAYCNNNPIMYTDPSGCFAITTAIIIGAIVGAVVGGTIGGVVTYNSAKKSGATGGELLGKTILGVLGGAVIGGAIGAAIGYGVGYLAGGTYASGLTAKSVGTGVKTFVSQANKVNHVLNNPAHKLTGYTTKSMGRLMKKTLSKGIVGSYKSVQSAYWAAMGSEVTFVVIDNVIKISDMWIR